MGIFDSAGHYLPGDVTERIAAVAAAVDVPVIFHGHNNLGMAVANSVAAVEAGAAIVDGCARGFGAGAGNTQLEVLVAVLERLGHRTGIDLYRLLDAADLAQQRLMPVVPTSTRRASSAGSPECSPGSSRGSWRSHAARASTRGRCSSSSGDARRSRARRT